MMELDENIFYSLVVETQKCEPVEEKSEDHQSQELSKHFIEAKHVNLLFDFLGGIKIHPIVIEKDVILGQRDGLTDITIPWTSLCERACLCHAVHPHQPNEDVF